MNEELDLEIEALRACYEACKNLDDLTFERIFVWLGERLREENLSKK